MFARFNLVLALVASLTAYDSARAQCGTWETKFNAVGLNGEARAVVSWDDGSGPAIYVGGLFTRAGNVSTARVARWDGNAWHALGAGFPNTVDALCVFDDGSGEALFAASAGAVKRWNGSTWQPFGAPFSNTGALKTFAIYDEGNGPHLFVGGAFTLNNSETIRSIARWDTTLETWTAVGSGVGSPSEVGTVMDMCVFDDGSGPALYVGGAFSGTATVASPDLLRWNGSAWSAVGSGVSTQTAEYVLALSVFDDGSGPTLALAGSFASASGVSANRVARWNGSAFSAFGDGLPNFVSDLLTFPGANGDELIAGGNFSTLAPTNYRGSARWNGTTWETLGGPGITVNALATHDAGDGARVVAVGTFASQPANRIATFDGASWSPLPDGLGVLGSVRSFATFDDGSGPQLYVGGNVTSGGTVITGRLARWNGSEWSALSSNVSGGSVNAMVQWDDGGGRALFAAGGFITADGSPATHIARWDGAQWSTLGTGVGDPQDPIQSVEALGIYDDGSGEALYAGGGFSTAGGQGAVGIARWNGSAWSDLNVGVDGPVFALQAFDDGAGPSLFVAGDFLNTGNGPANRIARWDGSTWHALGLGATNGTVTALAVFDDGSGAKLYAGGNFTVMGGLASPGLAVWNGTTWSPGTIPAGVTRLIVADLGSGPDLLSASGSQLWRRSGGTWTQIAAANGAINALAMFDAEADGTPDVFIGGGFATVNTILSSNIASMRGCTQTAESFCFGDGLGVACPCGNSGDIGHGCENSTLSGGALLAATGVGSVANDSLRLDCSGVPTNTSTLFVQATGQANGGIGSVLGDGLLCISGAVLRIGSPIADGETSSVGFGTGSQLISIKGQIPQAGATRHYQVRYRNVASYCTSATFNQSNGVSVVWAP